MKRGVDIRWRFVLLTTAAIAALGMVISLLPESGVRVAEVSNEADTGDSEPAWQATRHAQEMRNDEIAQRFQQGVLMLHAKHYEEAATVLHRVLELAPKMPEAHVNMGFVLLAQGHTEAARDFFETAIDLRPRQANAYYGLAVSLERACDLAGAMGAMRTYIHLGKLDDPYLRKARAALWEWETALAGTEDGTGPRLENSVSASGCGQGTKMKKED